MGAKIRERPRAEAEACGGGKSCGDNQHHDAGAPSDPVVDLAEDAASCQPAQSAAAEHLECRSSKEALPGCPGP